MPADWTLNPGGIYTPPSEIRRLNIYFPLGPVIALQAQAVKSPPVAMRYPCLILAFDSVFGVYLTVLDYREKVIAPFFAGHPQWVTNLPDWVHRFSGREIPYRFFRLHLTVSSTGRALIQLTKGSDEIGLLYLC
jgi:hypothetical protein